MPVISIFTFIPFYHMGREDAGMFPGTTRLGPVKAHNPELRFTRRGLILPRFGEEVYSFHPIGADDVDLVAEDGLELISPR